MQSNAIGRQCRQPLREQPARDFTHSTRIAAPLAKMPGLSLLEG